MLPRYEFNGLSFWQILGAQSDTNYRSRKICIKFKKEHDNNNKRPINNNNSDNGKNAFMESQQKTMYTWYKCDITIVTFSVRHS